MEKFKKVIEINQDFSILHTISNILSSTEGNAELDKLEDLKC